MNFIIDTIEYLVCFANTCRRMNINEKEEKEYSPPFPPLSPVYYWSLTIRNFRIPFQKVWANGKEMRLENTWVMDSGETDFQQPIELKMLDMDGNILEDILDFTQRDYRVSSGYKGGVLITSTIQN
jgi:hypothetical protein